MTNAVDIICESCGARMRLSEALLSQIAGRTGRITCKRCEKKVGLDASGDSLKVTYGGRLVARDLDDGDGEPVSGTDPHLSEFPPGKKVNIPPPVSEELKARRRLRAMAAKHALKLPAVQKSGAPLKVPPPKMERGSLSPHTLADDDDRLIPVGRKVQAPPSTRETDPAFEALYPGVAPETSEPVLELSSVPTEAPLASVPSELVQAEHVPSSRRGAWIPWAIAAAALFALGVSLSVQLSGQDVLGQLRGDSGQLAEVPTDTASEEAKGLELAAAPEPAGLENEQRGGPAAVLEPMGLEQDAQPEAESVPDPVPQSSLGSASAIVGSGSTLAPAEDTVSPIPTSAVEEPEPAVLAPFSTAEASAALRQVTAQASGCRGPDDPSGVAKVQVTFAPSGRVTTAVVSGPPYAGTTVGSCIASRFRKATVSPFLGEHVAVSKTVTIQ